MKDQKGITLVALIITIIVMLILVAVTISVALQGGLFTNAREAAVKTKAAEVKEAMALAKAEVLSEYYKNMGTTGFALNGSQFATRVNGYLDDSLAVNAFTVNTTTNTFTFTTCADAEVNKYFNDNDSYGDNSAEKAIIFDVPVATN